MVEWNGTQTIIDIHMREFHNGKGLMEQVSWNKWASDIRDQKKVYCTSQYSLYQLLLKYRHTSEVWNMKKVFKFGWIIHHCNTRITDKRSINTSGRFFIIIVVSHWNCTVTIWYHHNYPFLYKWSWLVLIYTPFSWHNIYHILWSLPDPSTLGI